MSAIIPCIFGTTKGFEFVELAPLPFKMKDLLVAITHGEVELSLEDTCVKMLRVKAGSDVHTWIGLYRKAYEMGYSREGGYYGAGVWLSDTTVNAQHVLSALDDLSQPIRRLALEDRKFQRPLATIKQQFLDLQSPALSTLLTNKTPYLRGGINADARTCAFIAQPQATREIVSWAQTDALAHNFQSVIIAPATAFPRAGASGNITQYADLAALERTLERDYTARLAKSDAMNKDLQRRNQTLEAEVSQRKAEVQSLTQRNSQLENAAALLKRQTKRDVKGLEDDEGAILDGHNAVALIVTGAMAVVSILANFVLGWLYFDSVTRTEAITQNDQKIVTSETKPATSPSFTDGAGSQPVVNNAANGKVAAPTSSSTDGTAPGLPKADSTTPNTGDAAPPPDQQTHSDSKNGGAELPSLAPRSKQDESISSSQPSTKDTQHPASGQGGEQGNDATVPGGPTTSNQQFPNPKCPPDMDCSAMSNAAKDAGGGAEKDSSTQVEADQKARYELEKNILKIIIKQRNRITENELVRKLKQQLRQDSIDSGQLDSIMRTLNRGGYIITELSNSGAKYSITDVGKSYYDMLNKNDANNQF